MRNTGIILWLAALFTVLSCYREDPPQPVPDPAPTQIILSATSFQVAQAGETLTLAVTAPARPKVSGVPDWIRFGDGTYKDYQVTFTFEVHANTTYQSREAVLALSSTGVSSVKVTVSQEAAQKPAGPEPLEPGADADGWENAAACARNMGTGWNLGNTLDSNSGDINNMWIEAWSARTPSDYEKAWGQPVTTRELIHLFKEAGFGAIRVPVTWYPHIGTVTVSGAKWDMSTWTGYDVDPVWMARVKEVVGYVLDEGLYCILNVHHDTGDGSTAWLRASTDVYEAVKDRYTALWQQIATEFASCGQQLVFESFNEMLDNQGQWNGSSDDAYEAINLYNAAFVATVRATGGNNLHRNLILNTYSASPQAKGLRALRLPEDAIPGHLLAEVHSYSPYRFAFDNDNPQNTFDAACEQEVRGQIETINTCLVSQGIPCVLGEYGCTGNRTEAERAKQAACYVSAAAQYDIPCFYWMTLSDGEDRSVPKWSTPVLKDAILKAWQENKKQ